VRDFVAGDAKKEGQGDNGEMMECLADVEHGASAIIKRPGGQLF
jgi:hypothetical protein